MNNKFKKISLIAVLALSVSIGAVGCRTSNKKIDPNNVPNNNRELDNTRNTQDNMDLSDQNTNRHLYKESDRVLDNDMGNNDNNSMTERSKKIANKVVELNDIKSATVIITGDTALVGVNIPNNSSGKVTKELKDKVQNKVKDTDKNIDNVMVTADPDLIKRIDNVGNDIRSGKPLSGLGNEIEEIIRRITPNM